MFGGGSPELVAEDVNLPFAERFGLAVRMGWMGVCCWRFAGTFTSSATFWCVLGAFGNDWIATFW